MTASQSASRTPKQLDAGSFQPEISSFRLHLAAEGKAAKTVHTYTEAVQWFAGEHLRRETGLTGWEQVSKQDVQRWVVWLLDRYSGAYASNQCRAQQQFFKWLAAEDEIPDPTAGLKPPRVPDKPVPVFTDGDLPRLERTCAGRAFTQRRDATMIAVFKATGIRLSELAGVRYDPGDPRRSDIDLWHREITVHGKGRKTRVVKISFDAARSLDRYLRVRARHPQAHRPQLWLGAGNRGPMSASGIYQAIVWRGRQCGIEVFPHRFRHHFSHTWLDRGGAEGDLMELNGPPLRCSAATAPAPAAPGHAAATTASWPTHPDHSPPAPVASGTPATPSASPGRDIRPGRPVGRPR
jgi:integrase/recombinase XerD